jgi:hypothetical protein
MGEVISHAIGTCGENHPSILTIPAFILAAGVYFSHIKSVIKTKIQLWKRN